MKGSAPEHSVQKLIRQPEDGRYIDPSIGELTGEGSHQDVRPEKAAPQTVSPEEVFSSVPSIWEGLQGEPTYYGKPAIKSPVWIWTIPTYFYVGGVAGAAMVLGSAAQMFGRGRRSRELARRCYWMGAAGGSVSSVLLIADLGKPSRFLNMLRVFRPTSPMSIGSWILAEATPCSLIAAVFGDAPGWCGRMGRLCGYQAGLLGVPLAGYTGVLLANTAVPLWQQSRRFLPVLFIGSAMMSAASLLKLIPLSRGAEDVVNTFGTAGAALELAAAAAVERQASRVEQVSRPLHDGATGALWKAAKLLTAASLAVAVLPIDSRKKRRFSGALGTAGALALRFAIFHAGKVSARDPHATFRQQRAGFGGAEVTGRPAITGPPRTRAPRPVPTPATKEEIWEIPQLTQRS